MPRDSLRLVQTGGRQRQLAIIGVLIAILAGLVIASSVGGGDEDEDAGQASSAQSRR